MKWSWKIGEFRGIGVYLHATGLWLDNLLETRVLSLLGFALGVLLGIWHLIAMTKNDRTSRSGRGMNNDSRHD